MGKRANSERRRWCPLKADDPDEGAIIHDAELLDPAGGKQSGLWVNYPRAWKEKKSFCGAWNMNHMIREFRVSSSKGHAEVRL